MLTFALPVQFLYSVDVRLGGCGGGGGHTLYSNSSFLQNLPITAFEISHLFSLSMPCMGTSPANLLYCPLLLTQVNKTADPCSLRICKYTDPLLRMHTSVDLTVHDLELAIMTDCMVYLLLTMPSNRSSGYYDFPSSHDKLLCFCFKADILQVKATL